MTAALAFKSRVSMQVHTEIYHITLKHTCMTGFFSNPVICNDYEVVLGDCHTGDNSLALILCRSTLKLLKDQGQLAP